MERIPGSGALVKRLRGVWVAVCAFALFALVSAVPASADPPAPFDPTSALTAGKDEITRQLALAAPVVFAILALLCGVALAWKLFKKGARSA